MKSLNELKKVVDEFAQLCLEITKTHPYYIPIVMHEFSRNLYPYDIYLGFRENENLSHTERVYTCTKNLCKYLKLNSSYPTYKNNLKIFETDINNQNDMNEINSLLYDTIWNDISLEAITTRSKATLEDMFQRNGYKDILKGKTVLDIGCGSGRFSIAMATMGAKHVTGIDIGLEGLKVGKRIAKDNAIENITFDKVDAENLPYSDQSFDFVFSYGVLHVLKDMNKAFSELARVVKKNGNAFVFIYGSGGIYWYSRRIMKTIMKEIPLEYSKKVLKLIFLPEDRWLFLDNWYDAIEIHSKDIDMQRKFLDIGFNSIDKIDRVDKSDLHYHAINSGEEGAIMWGEGFLRYMLGKKI